VFSLSRVLDALRSAFMAVVDLRDVPLALFSIALWWAAEPKNSRRSRCSECKMGIAMA